MFGPQPLGKFKFAKTPKRIDLLFRFDQQAEYSLSSTNPSLHKPWARVFLTDGIPEIAMILW